MVQDQWRSAEAQFKPIQDAYAAICEILSHPAPLVESQLEELNKLASYFYSSDTQRLKTRLQGISTPARETPLYLRSQYGRFYAWGHSPLHMSAHNNHASAIDILVQNGADVNLMDRDGRPALDVAASFNALDAAAALIRNGADVNPRLAFEQPLRAAVMNIWPDMVKLLLENGAAIFPRNVNEPNIYYGISKIDMFLERQGEKKNHSLACEQWYRDEQAIKNLLKTARRDAKLAQMPDELAVRKSLGEKYHWMHTLMAGEKPFTPDEREKMAELSHDMFGVEMQSRLSEYGLTLNRIFQSPLLASAVHLGSSEGVKIMLDSGADVNEKNADWLNIRYQDQTALHVAAERGHREIAEILMDYGADLYAVHNGKTPLQSARERGKSEVADSLFKTMTERTQIGALQPEFN